jgi:hypothetical protein
VPGKQASNTSSIASTVQQLSISCGVAAAGLMTAIFIPDRLHSMAGEMVRVLQESFLALGAFTILSTLVFSSMKAGKGADRARTSMRRH